MHRLASGERSWAGVVGVLAVSALLLALLQAVTAAEAAAPSRVASASDAAGDVKLTRTPGLSAAKRRSVDLRRVTIREIDDRTYRVTVKIRRLARPGSRWDQMFFVRAADPQHPDDVTEIGFTHRSKDGGFAYDSRRESWCDLKKVTRRPKKRLVAVRVPQRCMPWPGARVRAKSYTGHFRTDAAAWSRDRMKVAHNLQYP